MAVARGVTIDEVAAQLARLDARVKLGGVRSSAGRQKVGVSPGQLGLDFNAPPAAPTGKGGAGTGEPCGAGWISPDKTCHKGQAGQKAPRKEGSKSEKRPGADSGTSLGKRTNDARRRLVTTIGEAGGLSEEDAGLVADFYLAKTKEGGAGAAKLDPHIGQFTVIHGAFMERAALRKALAAAKQWKAGKEHVLTNPSRVDPGLAPKAKQPGINAQDVTTTAQQAQLARQQRQAAAAAGDQQGAKAWQEAERKAERDRLQMAMNRGQQQQSSLFGVTEFDETMPLFRQRRDSVDPVAQLVGQILREQLPGAQVLDWSRPRQGITAGRAVSEGLVYRFRCDSDSIGYQPAWDGIDEQQWELRSEGFLAARDPSTRLDFKRGGGVKFQQAKTKRQCSKGYGCGSACISMNKECRVQPSSAISKVRLRQLQALAQEGDAKAAARAQEVQMERDAKAQGLQEGRQTAKLKKLLEDPRVAEMVRTGKIPEAGGQGDAGAPQPGQVRNVTPDQIEVDPERFQYKVGASSTGEVGSLSGVQRWDPNLAGVISVWQDPEDGKTYVVNGHNRLGLARRLGAEEVTVRYLKAKDAQEARAIGAMQNIAEGAGSEVDAGKFFRDTGLKTLEEVKAKGLPLSSGKAQAGLALAQLPDEMFQDVIQGNLRMRRAAVIGGSGLDQDKQREVYKVLKARPSMTDETLQEYVQHLEVSTRQSQTEIDLFGANETSVDTGLARAELANGLKKALGREARLLGAVSRTQQAKELLEQKGGNVINVEQSQRQASEASSVLRTFDQLKNLSGPIRSALDEAAARVTAGENRNKVARELREAVVQAMEEELRNAGLKPEQPPRDELTMNLFDSADRFTDIEARLDALKRKCQTGYACGSACISPAKECREGGSTSKERAQRLEQIAQGGEAGRGIGQLRGQAAAAKAEEIRGNRSARAAQLRQERSQQRRGGALAVSSGQPGAIDVEVVSSSQAEPARPSGGKPGGIADTIRQALNAMKAADARQMGMMAEQLFETDWILERRGRYRGMSKDQAREAYKVEFAKRLQQADQARRQRGPSDAARKAAEAGSVAGAMRSLIEDMKASDKKLEALTNQAIDLRVQAEEFNEGGDEGALGGRTSRRRLDGSRRDSESSGGGEQCGNSWIDPNKTCRIGKGGKAVKDVTYKVISQGETSSIAEIELRKPEKHKTWSYGRNPETGSLQAKIIEVESAKAFVGAYLFKDGYGSGKVSPRMAESLARLGVEDWPEPVQTFDVWFKTGWSSNDLDTERSDFSQETGRALARAASAQIRDLVSKLPDWTILTCTPEHKDGLEDKRSKAFRRVGFVHSPIGMIATVRDGKIVPVTEYLASRRQDSGFVPDWEGFARDLAGLPEFGGEDGTGSSRVRRDGIESCMARLAVLSALLQVATA